MNNSLEPDCNLHNKKYIELKRSSQRNITLEPSRNMLMSLFDMLDQKLNNQLTKLEQNSNKQMKRVDNMKTTMKKLFSEAVHLLNVSKSNPQISPVLTNQENPKIPQLSRSISKGHQSQIKKPIFQPSEELSKDLTEEFDLKSPLAKKLKPEWNNNWNRHSSKKKAVRRASTKSPLPKKVSQPVIISSERILPVQKISDKSEKSDKLENACFKITNCEEDCFNKAQILQTQPERERERPHKKGVCCEHCGQLLDIPELLRRLSELGFYFQTNPQIETQVSTPKRAQSPEKAVQIWSEIELKRQELISLLEKVGGVTSQLPITPVKISTPIKKSTGVDKIGTLTPLSLKKENLSFNRDLYSPQSGVSPSKLKIFEGYDVKTVKGGKSERKILDTVENIPQTKKVINRIAKKDSHPSPLRTSKMELTLEEKRLCQRSSKKLANFRI